MSLTHATENEVSVIAASGDSKGNPIRCRSCIDGGLFVSTDNPQLRVMSEELTFVTLCNQLFCKRSLHCNGHQL